MTTGHGSHAPPRLVVTTVGMATVQDLGRPGHGHQGISVNGAGDRWAAQVGNTVVGNAPTAPLLEVTASSLSVRPDADVLVCVTGADAEPRVAGRPLPTWEPVVVAAGATLDLPAPRRGMRTYLAVAGGSHGTVGARQRRPRPHARRRRQARPRRRLELTSCVCGWAHPHLGQAVFRLGAARPTWPRPTVVEVTAGPELAEFDVRRAAPGRGRSRSSPTRWACGPRVRPPPAPGSAEILSRGVPVGAVEVPPRGGLLLLLHGRLITAGYPVPYVATTAAVDRLARRVPATSWCCARSLCSRPWRARRPGATSCRPWRSGPRPPCAPAGWGTWWLPDTCPGSRPGGGARPRSGQWTARRSRRRRPPGPGAPGVPRRPTRRCRRAAGSSRRAPAPRHPRGPRPRR